MSRYGFLRQPRWLALGFLVLVIVPSFVLLSRWQLSRLDQRRHANQLIIDNANVAPVGVATVMRPGANPATGVGDDLQWRQVTAVGTYDVAHQVLVRKRPFQGQNGFWVATPLTLTDGSVLIVNRGWVGAGTSATAAVDVPPPPSGQVTVVGRLQPSEQAPIPQPSDLPAGQVTDLDVRLFAGSQTFPGYVDLVASSPAQAGGLEPIPIPDLSDGPHLSYAVQWIFFAIVAAAGFVILARREREYAAARDEQVPQNEAATP